MGRILILILVFLGLYPGQAQQLGLGQADDPVRWEQSVKQLTDSTYLLIMEASLEQDWHLYSQHSDPGGAMPAEFEFKGGGSGFKRIGPVVEGTTYVAYNDIFEVDETFFKDRVYFEQKIQVPPEERGPIRVSVYYQVCKEVCIPGDHQFVFFSSDPPAEESALAIDPRSRELGGAIRLDLQQREVLNSTGADTTGQGSTSLWSLFGLGFLGGLIALLTPCVFPMIPLTVSFFTKQSKKRSRGLFNASFYGFCIVLIYFLLSVPFHLFDSVDSQILNSLATNIWLNLFFFLVFAVFAFSFFGYYELTLPSSWASRADAASEKAGGAIGIFFMALTLAIVSFSCTGPILGGLLGSTALAEGDVATNLTAGMLGFGLALALPFALFALFPAWLNRLPQSGGWMETVKVVLGFLELGLAFKFLSNADLVGHWGLLKREVFLVIWILLSLGLAAYLLGWFRFSKNQGKARLNAWRVGGSIVSIVFAGYLAYGLVTEAPLRLLSGFPPPDFYTLRETETECPLGLECYKDFEAGLEQAQATGKPILLDFTGWACVNCRKMEEQVWSQPEVFRLIDEEYILVSLYVDDRELLPEDRQFKYRFESGRVKEIRTVGDLWSTFQTVNFGAISQPYYVQLSPQLEVLNPAIQNADADRYRKWLASGVQTHSAISSRP